MKVYLDAVSLYGPGLPGWDASLPLLRGETSYSGGDLPAFASALLPATERRRAGKSVKLAIEIAQQAAQQCGIDPATPAMVFASSSGDTDVLSAICESLAGDDRLISPTRFHNSVHNAPAGYWSIAVGSRQPSNSIACREITAAAGLLEAATQCVVEQTPVLLAVYDIPFPFPMNAAEPITTAFGSALVLQPHATAHSRFSLDLELIPGTSAAPACDGALESLRRGVPAARLLPLLQLLANDMDGTVQLDYIEPHALRLSLTRCGQRGAA